ncbi:unnamed protein product [Brassica oleracea var. botrytis]
MISLFCFLYAVFLAKRFLAGRTYGGSGGWALGFLSCSSS